tara:strand:- start:54999 stop:55172 length:174 start_codon:yes stop_codon:yes gene_type:complete
MKIVNSFDWVFATLTILIGSFVIIVGSLPAEYLFIQLMVVLLQTFRVGYTFAKEGLL